MDNPANPASPPAAGGFPPARTLRAELKALAAVAGTVARTAGSSRLSLAAAGCAFFAVLALFPALTMLVFVYGLAFDPRTVMPQLQLLREVLPPEAFVLIAARLHHLVGERNSTLGLGLLVSGLVTLWSAANGTKAMLNSLNHIYGEQESRGFLRFQATALGITLGAVVGLALAVSILVLLPPLIRWLGLSAYRRELIHIAGVAILLGFAAQSFALLYRFGPSRIRANRRRYITPGAALATLVWLAVSYLLTFYVDRVIRLDVTYGPLGAAVGVMLWFYVTVYAVLFGAELNAALDRHGSASARHGAFDRSGPSAA